MQDVDTVKVIKSRSVDVKDRVGCPPMMAHSLDEFERVSPAIGGRAVLLEFENPRLFPTLDGPFALLLEVYPQTSEINGRNVLCSMAAAERKTFLEFWTEDPHVVKGW